jgi:hypothetical protein
LKALTFLCFLITYHNIFNINININITTTMPAMYLNDNASSSAVVVSSLTTKIAEGSEITGEDLRAADALLKNNDSSVPALDRSFLERWSTNQPQLVRYFGMVQDMLEPEYYVSSLDGKSTHFRDVPVDVDCYSNSQEEENAFNPSNLAERTPHMVVPLPFASEWFLESKVYSTTNNHPANDSTITKIPESPEVAMATTTKNRKRDRDGVDDDHNDDDDEMDAACATAAKPRTEDGMECEEDQEPRPQGQELDWWPSGCMGSAPGQCPVLAKLYYDQISDSGENQQRRLRLNDLVELVGILSMDPWEADFSQNNDDFFGTTPPPPPSRLPRLHVLSYQISDLDTLARRHDATKEEGEEDSVVVDHEEQPSTTMSSPHGPTNSMPLADICHSMVKDPILADALCMTLLSKAQREQPDAQMQRAGQHAIGCLSLQISTHASKQVFQQLHALLREVCPVVATVDLSKSTTTTTTEGPSKLQGRLGPTTWQLPRGATVLIHVGGGGGGGDSCSPANRELLEGLLGQHSIPYSFDGGMKVPFDADFRIVVVSSSCSSATAKLPCSMHLSLAQDLEGPLLLSSSYSSGGVLSQFRSSLAECRIIQTVGFSDPAILERAQQDFLAQRQTARKMAASVIPQEEDFHRWLTLTRLQARSRRRTSATIPDWERALELDLNAAKQPSK